MRSRSLFFFSAVNPVIETGGVMGESKIDILNRLPHYALPQMVYIDQKKAALAEVLSAVQQAGISYPFVAKPNIGERGFLVEKIDNKKELEVYLKNITVDFIIQSFISYPLEISVLYYRMPDQAAGKITSICLKKNLSVKGDGCSTVEQLMQKYPRARFQLTRFRKDYPQLLKSIPALGEEMELEPIGNHCRGTTFLNGNKYITPQLEKVFDKMAKPMEGIYYGRFDMKCASIELLNKGEQFSVMEFNGIASEPAHIYDPSYPLTQAYRDIFQHWKIIYQIAKIQRQKGIKAMSWSEAYQSMRKYLAYMKMAKV